MKIRPGINLLLIAGLTVLLASGAFAFPGLAWAALALCIFVIPLAAMEFFRLHRDIRRTEISRFIPGSVARGRTFKVAVDINFPGPETRACLRDEIPAVATSPLLMYETILRTGTNQLTYPMTIPKRGHHRFGDVWIRLIGQWGLLEIQQHFAIPGAVKVLPESLVPDDELKKDALDERRMLDQVRQTRQRGHGTEFESLSEYREGDDIRRIDWRASARQGRLIMCRYQLERHRDVVILVDCGRLMGTAVGNGTKLDRAVDSALVIARVALQGGDRCGLGVFDSKVRGYLSPVAGVASHRTLVERLYNVEPSWTETNFAPMFATLQARQLKRSMIVILSDMMEEDTTERYRAALMSLRTRHVVLFAALKTPLLTEAAYRRVESARDAAGEVFALRLMREREQTLHTLDRGGVYVLDVEPQNLTVPLLNLFLETKQRTA